MSSKFDLAWHLKEWLPLVAAGVVFSAATWLVVAVTLGPDSPWIIPLSLLGTISGTMIFAGLRLRHEPCRSCASRWRRRVAGHWMHQRKDGGPDRRYKHNPYIEPRTYCFWCGTRLD